MMLRAQIRPSGHRQTSLTCLEQVQPGHENHVEVSGVKISADPAIHSHSLDKRKCKFYDESDLVFHTGYSYTRFVLTGEVR